MQVLFLILAAVALISGVLVVIQVNPVRSALYLILNFFTVAGIYLLAHAEFIAAIQVIVYAGAIMVLFLFVIMLLNLRQPEEGGEKQHLAQKISGAALAGVTALLVIYTCTRINLGPAKEMVPGFGSTEAVARSLFTDYLLPFEVTSVLLLVALIGAVILARARLD
ncbi:MAG: NADH-quinone oxidoreductase subunit J [Desulfobacca sp.]|nr:NADH-quinone oxidoreductase subunit J [Desulfobacca sp.]